MSVIIAGTIAFSYLSYKCVGKFPRYLVLSMLRVFRCLAAEKKAAKIILLRTPYIATVFPSKMLNFFSAARVRSTRRS